MNAQGGAFLIEDCRPQDVFTPEDFTEEHHAIARTTDEFWAREVEPHLEAIRALEAGAAVTVLRKAAELGLTAISIPERYGGMELDLVSALVVAERLGRDGSYSGWHGAHTGIGTLPVLLFGTEEQKQKYLPRLASVELLAAYALTEPHAGSDALAARTRADLNPEGTHYILNGQKMWITNGGAADLFVVFAKIAGEQFTAFLVERAFPGVSSGHEEKKMGLKGSSTTAVYFDHVPVPKENVLGEIGRGHIIAFNILNLGRLKLGPFCTGAAKHVLAASLRYAKERKAFGSAIAEFGVIRHKLAEMAIRAYAAESMTYRAAGLIEGRLKGHSWDQPDAAQQVLKAVEEFAPECSMVKVFASEMLDYVVDEGVQIHGGYGYHQDYLVERAYRDSRINRIFEGTNEINRLLTTGMLLKRAARGQLALVGAAQKALGEALSPGSAESGGDERLIANAKKIALVSMGAAYQRYLMELDKQQEILSGIADMLIEIFAMESAWLRARKTGSGAACEMAAVYLRDALGRIEVAARGVLAASAEGDNLRALMAMLRRFAKHEPIDAIAARRRIAERLLDAGRYVV
jgi:alkylation response protein AidB-like acyl-CoA dehydrogenase